ncbi:hypothetical protein [Paraburkholderia sp. J12]|uniref:hypothetical protein n=1 Tax=Paraburkholderia sp. J12 TaxID=2805432 RepID=UPI002ABE75D9|nr:hypothetical protein [Paraburkholderia sp. J12]
MNGSVYVLLKAAHGIPDAKNREHRSLTAEQVAVAQISASRVQLHSIKDLKGVNALAEGKTLSFSPDGLTVIYGDNGVGKSGYSRVLKQACRARDQSEKIRGNVYVNSILHETPSATFNVTVDGVAAEFSWEEGTAAPAELSTIAIFDSHCARAYVDNHGDFAYAPYGLDILEGLAKVCAHLKERANADMRASQPKTDVFSNLSRSATEAGRLALGLSAKTQKADVERLGTLSEAETQRLDLLTKMLGEADPKKKAAELRAKALRIDGLARKTAEALIVASDQKITDLRTLIQRSEVAKAAAAAAAKRFEAAGGLEGTCNQAWGELFGAARAFCATSGPVKAFPKLSADSSCPLCQNALGTDGAARLLAFDEFIQGEATAAATKARKEAVDAFRVIADAPLDLALDEALKHDLESQQELIEGCAAVQVTVRARREATRAAATPGSGSMWDQVPAMVNSPVEGLVSLVAQLRDTAKALEGTMDAKERATTCRSDAPPDRDAAFRGQSLCGSVLALRPRSCAQLLSDLRMNRNPSRLRRGEPTSGPAASCRKCGKPACIHADGSLRANIPRA